MRILLLVVIWVGMSAPAHAADWVPEALTSEPGRNAETVTAAIGPDGTAAVAWVDRDPGVSGDVPRAWVVVRPPGGGFGPAVPLGAVAEPTVAVGPSGVVAVVWAAGSVVYGVIPPGATAVTTRSLPGTEGVDRTRFALDASGNATIAYTLADIEEGRPNLFGVRIGADGSMVGPQGLTERRPANGWTVAAAPGGQAAVVWPDHYAYSSAVAAGFEPGVRITSPQVDSRAPAAVFDRAGTLYVAFVEVPVDGGPEPLRTFVRPAGGMGMLSGPEAWPAEAPVALADEPAGGAVMLWDANHALQTRGVSPGGVLGPHVPEASLDSVPRALRVAPDGSRVALLLVGETTLAATRPPGGSWSFTPVGARHADGSRSVLAVGPSGESVAAWGEVDGSGRVRLRVISAGAAAAPAPAPGSGGPVPEAPSAPAAGPSLPPGGGGVATTPRAAARMVLPALIARMRAGVMADRRRIVDRRSLAAARRATTGLRREVKAVSPDGTGAKRARRALLDGLAHRAVAQRLAVRGRRAAALRRLTLASRDATRAAAELRR